jgi:hypothetical protein
MTDDVESTLETLERRLRALQAELDEADEPEAPPPRRRPPPPPEPPASWSPSSLAALDRFDDDLHRVTRELVASWERASAELRGEVADGMVFEGEVALEARADLAGLTALHRALQAIDGVAALSLRAYAGGHAALDVRLDRGVALVGELRRALDAPFAVEDARAGRLDIALG